MNVLYLPGLFSSEMLVRASIFFPGRKVWVDPAALLRGDLALLQLAPDGVSPGPLAGGLMQQVGAPIAALSWPMWAWLTSRGHFVALIGWDWRIDLLAAGQAVWAKIQPGLGSAPLAIVAHSAGGLVARAVYGAMQASGQGGQLVKLITIGTPHYGSWMPVLAWWRSHPLYRALRALCGWVHAPRQGQAWLDATIATWPGLYQLQPFAASGPLFTGFPDQAAAIYNSSWYAGANHYLLPSRWVAAQATQAALNSLLPAGLMTSIVGVSHPTIAALQEPIGAAGPPTSYVYADGDGVVTTAQASPPGVTTISVATSHDLQPLDPAVQVIVSALLAA